MMEPEQPIEESGEALAWLQKIFEHGKSTHNESLFSYLRGQTKQDDLTLPVVNLVTASCKAVFGSTCSGTKAAEAQLDPSACASYLYYMVAESLLQQQFPRDAPDASITAAAGAGASRRFKGMVKVSNPPACTALVSCQEFHLPLIECALLLVHHTITPTAQLTTPALYVSEVLQREDRAALLWQAARNFLDCFSPSSPFPMPLQLQCHLHTIQELLLSAPVFQTGSVMYELITEGGGCQFQPQDMTLAQNITAAYAALAIHQAQAIAWQLQHSQDSSSSSKLCPTFHEQCAWLMDQVVLQHIDLCFGVHMAVVVACVMYVTAKVLQTPLSFATITQVLSSHLSCQPSEVFADTELLVKPLQRGDLRAYYNTRFLPAVQGSVRIYLQQYTDWATNKQHPTLPAAAVGAKAQNPAPFSSQLPQDTTAAAEEEEDEEEAPAKTARVPFAALSKPKPLPTASGKAVSKAGLRPPSQVTASLDQENAAAHALAAVKHVYSMGQFSVGGVAQHSMHPCGEGQQGKVGHVRASMSPMHLR